MDSLEFAVNDAILNLSCVRYAMDGALQDLKVPEGENDSEEVRVLFGALSIVASTADMLMEAQNNYNNPTA